MGDPVCQRDWEGCPDGWKLVGSACLAPTSYRGACDHVFHLGGLLSEKERFANECQAPWPCAGECAGGHDYDSGCPNGWVEKAGFCENPNALASSKCSSRYLFSVMDTGMKQNLASTCGIEWACRTVCEEDYGALCPEGWSAQNEQCYAPASYVGECKYAANLSGLSAEEKRAFSNSCAAPFPCIGSDRVHDSGDSTVHGGSGEMADG